MGGGMCQNVLEFRGIQGEIWCGTYQYVRGTAGHYQALRGTTTPPQGGAIYFNSWTGVSFVGYICHVMACYVMLCCSVLCMQRWLCCVMLCCVCKRGRPEFIMFCSVYNKDARNSFCYVPRHIDTYITT